MNFFRISNYDNPSVLANENAQNACGNDTFVIRCHYTCYMLQLLNILTIKTNITAHRNTQYLKENNRGVFNTHVLLSP